MITHLFMYDVFVHNTEEFLELCGSENVIITLGQLLKIIIVSEREGNLKENSHEISQTIVSDTGLFAFLDKDMNRTMAIKILLQ